MAGKFLTFGEELILLGAKEITFFMFEEAVK
jgi:hypothetical protein